MEKKRIKKELYLSLSEYCIRADYRDRGCDVVVSEIPFLTYRGFNMFNAKGKLISVLADYLNKLADYGIILMKPDSTP